MNKYNLCDEKWIPVVSRRRVSLVDIFTDRSLKTLEGNAVQKLALTKLFFAIAQRACRVKDEESWRAVGIEGLAERCKAYLENHHEDFYLYGDKPFLQMPVLRDLNVPTRQIYYDYQPDLASENNTLMRENDIGRALSDAEKAVFILSLMNYAPSGKRVASNIFLTKGFEKSKSAKAGPSLGGYVGYISSFIVGQSILETVYLNLFTEQDIEYALGDKGYDSLPPWEKMPEGENTEDAILFKQSLWPWYIAVSRFVLLEDEGIRYIEGIQYPSKIEDGYFEPYIMINRNSMKSVYVDVSKKPWRILPSLLEAVFSGEGDYYECVAIKALLSRARTACSVFGIWTGGLRVRSNSGEQFVKQNDDYVESMVFFEANLFDDTYYNALKTEFAILSKYEQSLVKAVRSYFSEIKVKEENMIIKASSYFWQYCDSISGKIIGLCNDSSIEQINKSIWRNLIDVYDKVCFADTPRQLHIWAKNKPHIKKEA